MAGRKKKSGKEVTQTLQSGAVPNWPLLILALLGMGLAAYLTAFAWAGQAVAGCAAGSGCDVVLSSRWAKTFGLPTSLWGFLAYASLAGIAFIKRSDLHWKLAWMVALFGVLFSAYLTAISFAVLQAACPYCLASLTLMVAILATVTYQRPAGPANFSWRPWLLQTATGALIVVITMHLYYAGIRGKGATEEEPRVRALAEHLAKTDAKFYGAYWCPHCNEQKELFGASAPRLPYVECSPQGRSAPQATPCRVMNIRQYPTWIINNRRHEGVLTVEELAEYSGFKGGF